MRRMHGKDCLIPVYLKGGIYLFDFFDFVKRRGPQSFVVSAPYSLCDLKLKRKKRRPYSERASRLLRDV